MKKTIRDYDLNNKKVIIRCDFNVPINNGIIEDDTRVRASIKTIKYALNKGASVILLSHLGKVKSESDKKDLSLYPVSIRLSELLDREVIFSRDTRSDNLTRLCSNLVSGKVLLIENTRFEDIDNNKESNCNEDLSKYWASLGDIFINDAYGTIHRNHASNAGISKYISSGIGFLIEEEISKIDGILNDDTHPFILIMGGSKVSDKISVIDNLINKCDYLLIGGGMAYTFLSSCGINVGNSIKEEDYISYCKDLINKYKNKIIFPIDSLVSTNIDSDEYKLKDIELFNDNDIGLDIGDKTIELFKSFLKDSKRVIINGPMGMFEKKIYEKGTKEVLNYLANNGIKTLVGGGDSVSAVNKLSDSSKFYHISTGGGATLKYLEGNPLPGLINIDNK